MKTSSERNEGVSVYDVAGVRDPEKEFQYYADLLKKGDKSPKIIKLYNYWAEKTGRGKIKRNLQGRIVSQNAGVLESILPPARIGKPMMPPGWS